MMSREVNLSSSKEEALESPGKILKAISKRIELYITSIYA
jgi:hypothetical protein